MCQKLEELQEPERSPLLPSAGGKCWFLKSYTALEKHPSRLRRRGHLIGGGTGPKGGSRLAMGMGTLMKTLGVSLQRSVIIRHMFRWAYQHVYCSRVLKSIEGLNKPGAPGSRRRPLAARRR